MLASAPLNRTGLPMDATEAKEWRHRRATVASEECFPNK